MKQKRLAILAPICTAALLAIACSSTLFVASPTDPGERLPPPEAVEPQGGAPDGAPISQQPAPPEPAAVVQPPASHRMPELPPDAILPNVSAESFIIEDADTGRILLQHAAAEPHSPASLTKVMTALLVLERVPDLTELVDVDDAVTALRASTLMGIKPGERISVIDLLYGLMLPSGNDAAVALARHVAGTEPAFVELMNRRAAELGMLNTRFTNSHGLDFRDWGAPRTTAYDLAVLTRAVWPNPVFRQLAGTRNYAARGEQNVYSFGNLNDLLWWYPGADGVKIGYTRAAKQTLIATATRDGRRVLVVELRSDRRSADGAALLDTGFRLLAEQPSPTS